MSSASESVAREPGPSRFQRLQLGVAMFGALVILLFAGSSAYDAWRSYRYALIATDREINNLAKALAEQTAWTVQTVDLMLIDTARWYESESNLLPPDTLDAMLATRTANVKPVRQVLIVDAGAQLVHHARPLNAPVPSFDDRSYFIAQRDHPEEGLFISEPLMTRTDNQVALVLSRRLEDATHRFAGVVTARVDLNDFRELYRTVDIDSSTAITLLRDDGTLLMRVPNVDANIGERYPALVAPVTEPYPRLRNPLDGNTDFIALAPVRDTPLKVVVTRHASAALHPWQEETDRGAARTLVLLLLGTAVIIALVRQLGRVGAGERALRESEERYALAMAGANEGHWDWDLRSDQLFLSPRMKVLGGLAEDTEVGSREAWRRKIQIHPDDLPRLESATRDHFEHRSQRFDCEYRVRHPSGDWHWLLARGRCLFDDQGKPLRFVGSAIDVTAEKQSRIDQERLETQLRQSQKMEAIGTLAGGIAHDFNNILGAILGYGELAQEHADGNRDLKRYLDNVMHATQRAKKLVERILGFSRSGLGNQVQFNAQAVVAETLELLKASLPVDIELRQRLEGGTAAVNGDPTDLHQVTMNLCTNAIQAMERGGVLDVVLERRELSERRVLARGALIPGSYIRMIVSDTGGGIPPAIVERIFDPFFTTKGVGQGTGLGLSLVHGIVNDLDGAIDVTTSSRGTCFEIWLPIAGELPAASLTPRASLPLGNGQVVMIVDDERTLVDLAEESISRLGYEPVGFDSSEAALRAFEDAPDRFDAVITDESMPGIAGTDLSRRIRELRPSLPIILMTGHGSASLNQRSRDIGIQHILLKPLQARDLAETLAHALSTASILT